MMRMGRMGKWITIVLLCIFAYFVIIVEKERILTRKGDGNIFNSLTGKFTHKF